MAVVFALLLTFALTFRVPLDAIADPSDATYVPRPEWYFLSLFQLLKYFPGPLEPVATIVIPGLVVGGLLLLPFLDRGPEPPPAASGRWSRRRSCCSAPASSSLTYLGLKDSPAHADPSHWGTLALAGREFVAGPALRDAATASAARRIRSPTRGSSATRSGCWRTSPIPRSSRPGRASRRPAACAVAGARRSPATCTRSAPAATAPEIDRRDTDRDPRLRPLVRQLPHHRRRRGEAGPGPDPRRREARRQVAARVDQRSRPRSTISPTCRRSTTADARGADGDRELPGRAEVAQFERFAVSRVVQAPGRLKTCWRLSRNRLRRPRSRSAYGFGLRPDVVVAERADAPGTSEAAGHS